jgi:hypothetical protein
MLRKQELSNPNSCLNRAADDEPVFVLRAHDPLASMAVRRWAMYYETRKRTLNQWDERAKKKHAEALMLADLMDDWHDRHPEPSR